MTQPGPSNQSRSRSRPSSSNSRASAADSSSRSRPESSPIDWAPAENGEQPTSNFRFLPSKPPGVQPDVLADQCNPLDAFFCIYTQEMTHWLN
ncbi:hypothetical protein PoB_002603600 [Plakobranchus ocellatus]|uniref:Uncharacterized protein n=1 Tax=Plakobranchus ocellatus TaxID=259542 RepID=A0AAV3ZK79_9GAST|nr:hypothetical protein PoB_002603600 [Plakobranchus ocellatus]